MIPSRTDQDLLLHALSFALAHYAALAGVAVLSYAIGRRITTHCRYHSSWERAAVCTTLGLGVTSYVVFVLCLAHWFYRTAVLGILAVAMLLCLSELRSMAREITAFLRDRFEVRRFISISLGGLILFLPFALLGLYPPQSWDALTYHLVVAKLYVQHHGFVFAPNVHFSLFPELTEMLFALMLTFFDDVQAQLSSLLMLAVLLVGVNGWARRFFSTTAGYWASAILLGIPIVVWLGSEAYVDMSLTLFATMTMYSCWNWLQDRTPQWLILAGAFAGCACGTKYSGLFFVPLLAAVIFFFGVGRRRYTAVVQVVAITLAVAAPWYARSVYYTGNPVMPYLSRVFGSGYWSAEDVAAQLSDVHNDRVRRTPSAFVSLPWQLAFHPAAFRAEYPGSKKFFLLMPLVIPFAFADKRIALLAIFAFSYMVFWFFTALQMRYLVPILPVIALSMAAASTSILGWRPLARPWVRQGLVAAVSLVWISSGWLTAVGILRERGALPFTPSQREEYVARSWPGYRAVKFLNSLKGPHYTLFALQGDTMAYYADGTFLGEYFGAARTAHELGEGGDNQGFLRDLESLGADYLLVVRPPAKLREDEFFHDHFRLTYARPPVELYEITESYK